ncbi:MAG: Gfo/Idh/MocA family oxidoreductase [Candidatus Solibacter usitatus]|nr:Gfo/Idh/MocA family oxidoreductase [Candidatus Solibacter usitatus]
MMSSVAATATQAVRSVASPNDTVRVAVVGCGGRGNNHMSAWTSMPNVELAGLVDVDDSHSERFIGALQKRDKKAPPAFRDIRKILDDKNIDAISIASPNHWHTLQTIWACQAGKDVYVEKPCSHNVFESRQIVAAARKYNRIVQMGSQSRSSPALQEAVQKMRDGEFGDVYMARGLCFKARNTIGKTPVEKVPPGVDYDMWTGPAPMRPFTKNRFHYNWHWFWDTGNGDLGNQGIHEVDIARWGLGVTHPTKVTAIGGKFMFDDDQETPNTISASYEFNVGGKAKMMTFEVRHWYSNHEAGIGGDRAGNTIGNTFYGSNGYLVIDNYNKYYSFMGRDQKPGPARNERDRHFENFITGVRSRKVKDLNAEIEEGAISCVLMHLANISYRLGRTLHWDEKTWTVKNDPEATRMLTRNYRAPYIVPAKV